MLVCALSQFFSSTFVNFHFFLLLALVHVSRHYFSFSRYCVCYIHEEFNRLLHVLKKTHLLLTRIVTVHALFVLVEVATKCLNLTWICTGVCAICCALLPNFRLIQPEISMSFPQGVIIFPSLFPRLYNSLILCVCSAV